MQIKIEKLTTNSSKRVVASRPSQPSSIHKKFHVEACQVLSRGVYQKVPTQIQDGEALQVEQLGIQNDKVVVTQVDDGQVESIEKGWRQFIQLVLAQVERLQVRQFPGAQVGRGTMDHNGKVLRAMLSQA